MGKLAKPQRSKKNKKIKSVDPFFKGQRKHKRSTGYNQKPKSYEQEVPKKLRMLGFSIDTTKNAGINKKSKNKFKMQKDPDGPTKFKNKFNTPLGAKSSQPKAVAKKETRGEQGDDKDDETPRKSKKERRKERFEEILKAKKKKPEIPKEVFNDYIDNLKPVRPYVQPKFKQKSTESDAQFLRRVNEETHLAITKSQIEAKFEVSDAKQMRESMRKAKKGLNAKKKQRLKEKKEQKVEAVKQKKRDKVMDFNALKDNVAFGDIVHAPPTLSVLPKKAKNVTGTDKPGLRMPELKDAIARNIAESQGLQSVSQKSAEHSTAERPIGKTMKRKNLSAVQKVASDAQRESVIEAYRMMKKKKS